ncbi:unnamed protein product [Absidia cylindrospora]
MPLKSVPLISLLLYRLVTNVWVPSSHVAHALNQYLYASPPSSDLEHSYVHPVIQSVFSSNSRFNVDWANMRLINDTCKPDLLGSSTCGSLPLALVIGEFKPPNYYNSGQTESDLVKL